MNYNSLEKRQKKRIIEKIIEMFLILLLIILSICMISDVKKLQGSARVVNYAGILRGATQRMVKLEIVDQGNDDLIDYLDEIFSGLMHGGGKYKLSPLNDDDYQKKLNALYRYWGSLKDEVSVVRKYGYKDSNIISMSEQYFVLADETVSAAENYSQQHATNLDYIEKALIAVTILIVLLLLKQSTEQVKLLKGNRELRKKAYIDVHTGLPNKSKCSELLLDTSELTEPTSVVIFDLNGLKKVNDHLGHLAGDTLIMNFANALRTSIPQKYFVGRYGGDEFIAILDGADIAETEIILAKVQREILRYNELENRLHLSFAYGYASSTSYRDCSLKVLLEQADKNMYRCKGSMKERFQKEPEK